MTLTFNEVAVILGLPPAGEGTVSGISIDSRKTMPGDLFCAIVGKRADGHEYVSKAIESGAAAVLVTRPVTCGVPVFEVNAIEEALAKIAGTLRATFPGKVIGVTGSAGKTSAKEYLAAALGANRVLKTEGNLNTEFGVPVSWMKLLPRHEVAVIEMAMRGPGQIAHLCSFSKPHIGVVTSLGSAHIGELGGREQIARAKAELIESLPVAGIAIIPFAGPHTGILRDVASCSAQTFGTADLSDWQILSWETDWHRFKTEVEIVFAGERVSFSVPGVGSSAAHNATCALAAAIAAGTGLVDGCLRIGEAESPAGRMELLCLNGAAVLCDVYNSSPESCAEALSNMSRFEASGRRVAVLGDMLELGEFSEPLHREIGAQAACSGVTELVLVGSLAPWIGSGARDAGFDGPILQFDSADAVAETIASLRAGDVALLKASRSIELERALPNAEANHA